MHNIELMLMPSMRNIPWDSPKSLLIGATKCVIDMSFRKDVYMFGHLAIHLDSPLIDKEHELMAMTNINPKDKPDGVFKRHLGFGVLGEPIRGRLENTESLERRIEKYIKRDKFAYIRYKISESGMKRVIAFIKYFTTKIEGTRYAPCDFYSGVMNPIYKDEGAGCTSLGMTILEQAGVPLEYADQWKISYNIPMNLVGGKFNENHRIKVRDVLKGNHWYPSDETKRNKEYIECEMYDPTIMYHWVQKLHEEKNGKFDLKEDKREGKTIRGVEFDYSSKTIENPDKPLLKQREKENFFVNQYKSMILQKQNK